MLHWLRPAASPPAPAPSPTLTLRQGDAAIAVAWRRSPGARRLTLRVSAATGRVTVTTPARTSARDAQRFLDDHAGWIAARVAALPGRVPFADGAAVPLRGVPHLLRHRAGRAPVTAEAGPEPVLWVGGDAAALPGRVRRFLAAEAAGDLGAAVARYTAALGVAAGRVSIRDTRSRWGSCSAGGHLSFSWRLVMAPPLVLDYLAAHEVAHLRELNHSARFWRLVHGVCPGTDEAEAWLKRHGAGLHRYG